MGEIVDLLETPVYGTSQVDRILRLYPGTTERWVDGYTRSGRRYQPVVRTESTGIDIVTWGEFSEVRRLAEYRGLGVPMVRMRPTVEELRERTGHRYPLAYAKILVDPLGRELVERVQDTVRLADRLRIVVVRNGQLVLSQPAERFLSSVDFGPDGVIETIHPHPKLRHVVFDPLRQFGEPVVRSVPTAVIAEQYRAGDTILMIAEAYALDEDHVEEAIRYELERGLNAPRAA